MTPFKSAFSSAPVSGDRIVSQFPAAAVATPVDAVSSGARINQHSNRWLEASYLTGADTMTRTQTGLTRRDSTWETAKHETVDVERSKAPTPLADVLSRKGGTAHETLLTYQQAATMLQISLRQFRRLIDDKRLPFVIVSERVRRIRPTDIREFVHQYTVRQV